MQWLLACWMKIAKLRRHCEKVWVGMCCESIHKGRALAVRALMEAIIVHTRDVHSWSGL